MSTREDRFWSERMAVRYLDALDMGDLETIAALWEQAADNPELARLLDELNQGLEEEEGLKTSFATDAARVVALAQRHLPSAFPPAEQVGPLVAADVARRLEAEPEFRRLAPADRVAHARLLGDATPLPLAMGKTGLTAWLRSSGIIAGPHYIKLFRHVAILMDMTRAQGETRLAAARPVVPPRGDGGGAP